MGTRGWRGFCCCSCFFFLFTKEKPSSSEGGTTTTNTPPRAHTQKGLPEVAVRRIWSSAVSSRDDGDDGRERSGGERSFEKKTASRIRPCLARHPTALAPSHTRSPDPTTTNTKKPTRMGPTREPSSFFFCVWRDGGRERRREFQSRRARTGKIGGAALAHSRPRAHTLSHLLTSPAGTRPRLWMFLENLATLAFWTRLETACWKGVAGNA